MNTADQHSRKLILHVGPHKTGSTSIQHLLKREQARLKSRGIGYEDLSHLEGGVHRLADSLSVSTNVRAMPVVQTYVGALKFDTPTTIISSENFSRLNGDQIRDFVAMLPCDTVEVVYFLRNPLSRMSSQWRENVKHGYRHTLLEYAAARLARPFLDRALNDAINLQAWSKTVGSDQMKIHLYDQVQSASQMFFDTYCGGLVLEEGQDFRSNNSIDTIRTEVYRALAGYQWHLLTNRHFDNQVRSLCAKADALCQDPDHSYIRTFPITLESAALRNIERSLMTNFSFVEPADGPVLFSRRSIDLTYLGHEIWFENEALTTDLFALRRAIHRACGTPLFDRRLTHP